MLLLLPTACKQGNGSLPSSPARPANIILIVIDTLRADHLGCYGYQRDTSPAIDRLAASSVQFLNVRSQASCTFPSVNSLLTSRYPFPFVDQPDGRIGVPESVASLPRILQANGWMTAAVSASPIVRATASERNPHGGFGGGFDVFDESCEWADAACVTRRAVELMEQMTDPARATSGGLQAARPFFLYLHLMDPHSPYRPSPEQRARFVDAYQGHEFIKRGSPAPIERMLYANGPKVEIRAEDIEHLIDLYDAEIAGLDHQLSILLAWLEDRGLLEQSILVLTSDHGEDFLETGHIKHCYSLTPAALGVPLIIRTPTGPSGLRVEHLVQLVDVMPTLLEMVGLRGPDLASASASAGSATRPGSSLGGRSLTGLMQLGPTGKQDIQPRPAFSYQNLHLALDNGEHKLVARIGKPLERQLYHRISDPEERTDIWDPADPRALELEQQLMSWFSRTAASESLDAGNDPVLERLRALGYLE